MTSRHLAVLPILIFTLGSRLPAQAIPAATGPGSYLKVGVAVDGYHLPYGEQRVAGITGLLDANLTQRFGLEAEASTLRFGARADTRANTYLIGPRVSILRGTLQPYAKILFGRGDFTFPYDYADGSYPVIAPGGGLDIRVLHGRAYIRAIDFEYQDWRDFTFGASHPYGVSAGVSVRIF